MKKTGVISHFSILIIFYVRLLERVYSKLMYKWQLIFSDYSAVVFRNAWKYITLNILTLYSKIGFYTFYLLKKYYVNDIQSFNYTRRTRFYYIRMPCIYLRVREYYLL